MDATRLAIFLQQRIQETIDHIKYISNVEITYDDTETFGNNYISVNYSIEVNSAYEHLDPNDKVKLFKGRENYTFSLSTNENKYEKKNRNLILRILEFKHIYESLASYAALQFEKYRSQDFTINIKSINLWPAANYIEQFLLRKLDEIDEAWWLSVFDIEQHDSQWLRLHQLAKNTDTKEQGQFCITDIEIRHLTTLRLTEIRNIILDGEVPIKINDIKSIERISIHISRFIEAIKKQLKKGTYSYLADSYKELIIQLYKQYLPSEIDNVIKRQQDEFLKQFIIQKDDFIELKNGQIVMVDAVTFDADNAINIKYAIVKTTLEKSERTKVTDLKDVKRILKKENYLKYLPNVTTRHTSLLKSWMTTDGKKLIAQSFTPDLTE
jgi:hypothetical protein